MNTYIFIRIDFYCYCCRTKVECGGLCLATLNCYGFEWVESELKCDLMPVHGMCLDHQNKNPILVYADHDNIPPMCPGIINCFLCFNI